MEFKVSNELNTFEILNQLRLNVKEVIVKISGVDILFSDELYYEFCDVYISDCYLGGELRIMYGDLMSNKAFILSKCQFNSTMVNINIFPSLPEFNLKVDEIMKHRNDAFNVSNCNWDKVYDAFDAEFIDFISGFSCGFIDLE